MHRAYNTDLPECRRLSRVLATLDPHLRCAWDGMLQRYVVLAPSQSQGMTAVQILETDDGRRVEPDTAPMLILAKLAKQRNRLDVAKLADETAAAIEGRWKEQMETLGEYGAYIAKAAAAEWEGHLRCGADVFTGLNMAIEGRLKAPKVGLKYSLSGAAIQ